MKNMSGIIPEAYELGKRNENRFLVIRLNPAQLDPRAQVYSEHAGNHVGKLWFFPTVITQRAQERGGI